MNDRDTCNETTPVGMVDEAVPASSRDKAGVSMMITRRQRAALVALGVSPEAIWEMTPAEAHALLAAAEA